MQYILFTSAESFVDEVDLIAKFFANDVDYLYVQKPYMNDRQLERFLLSIPEEIRMKTFLCGSPSMAQEFSLAGFHQPMEWFVQNGGAALRASGLLSVEVEYLRDLEKLSPELRSKIFQVIVKNKPERVPENVFVACDATELSDDEPPNRAIVSGIWEFADSVSAWRRLCLK